MHDDERIVRPSGGTVRRLRHERGWSPRDLITAIGEAQRVSSGIAESISPNLLSGIEEHDERVPYRTLMLVSGGFDCDPVDLLGHEPSEEEDAEHG